MAIQVSGTQVIGNSRELTNIASIDATTATAIGNAGVGGKLLQVVQSNSNTSYTWSSSTSFQWATDHNVSITPSSTSSKILVTVMGGNFSAEYNTNAQASIFRGATKIQGSTADLGGQGANPAYVYVALYPVALCVLDSPNTTSSINYRLYVRSGTANAHICSSGASLYFTAMEIAA